ncbi:hypothetical protein TcasGA2_TC011567 [Tribolium castaneum]|uniref:Uncharacterized protein n=1 Tax=Tribolium castaneum TaxID=7070 RepID=D7GXX8_TRICA|nr:hypothetical protein TcasGA2_TC011567 [Tribolium castaneum]
MRVRVVDKSASPTSKQPHVSGAKLLPRSFLALVAQLSVAAGGSFYVKQPLADIQWAHKGIAGKTQKALESDSRIGWGW